MWSEIIDKIKAVIFDLDGTIIDSMNMWHQIDLDYFSEYGKILPDDYQAQIEGMSFHETAVFTKETYGFEHSVEEMKTIWNEMAFDYYSNHVQLKEGVVDFLTLLSAKGIKLGIATSNSKRLCMEVLEKRNLIDYFDVILTGDCVHKGKPEPDVYLSVADKLSVKPSDCLVFEDILNGIRAGNNAGMTTVAVRDDYSDFSWTDKIKEADYYIESFEEIVNEIH